MPPIKHLPHVVEVTLDNYLRGDPDGVGGLWPISEEERNQRIRAILGVIARIRRERLHRGTIQAAVKAIRAAGTLEDAMELAITELILRGDQ